MAAKKTKRHRVGGKKTRAQVADAKILQEWWLEARRKRDTAKNPTTRRKYVELADRIQYALQDHSPLGHRMVWGSEHAGSRDAGYPGEALLPRTEPIIRSRYGGRY